MTPLVRFEGAARTFGATVALQPTSFEVFPGDRIAVTGPSGSGKSTLLHLMAGLDEPTLGTVEWPAIGTRDHLRPGPVGVVFQGPSLIPPLTVAENVALPLVLAGRDERSAADAARRALDRLGLADLLDKLPDEISGGQAQRVAVVRALVGHPVLVLADEPTGQLDHPNASAVVDVLLQSPGDTDAALVVATHDPAVSDRLAERWEMRDGQLVVHAPEGAPVP